MKRKIKVGIIGTGFGARVHAPIMQNHPGYEVVSISSVARGRLEEVKKDTGIEKTYDNWSEMLEQEDLDLVAVASAPFAHHEMVLKAYERGTHVLCEKPMAFNAKESLEMIEAKDRTHRMGFINFEFRFLPARQKVKEIIGSGKLGRILHVNYSTSFPGYERSSTVKRGWLGQKEKAGGMLGAIGSHMFDSLLWWVDDQVDSLTGQLSTHVREVTDKNEDKEIRTADDAFQVAGTFNSGATFAVGLTHAARHQIGWRLEVFGTEGTLVMTGDNKVEVGYGNDPLHEVPLLPDLDIPKDMSKIAAGYYNAFYRSLDAVYQAIVEKKDCPHLPTFEHGHHVQKILDAVRESDEEGQRIEVG